MIRKITRSRETPDMPTRLGRCYGFFARTLPKAHFQFVGGVDDRLMTCVLIWGGARSIYTLCIADAVDGLKMRLKPAFSSSVASATGWVMCRSSAGPGRYPLRPLSPKTSRRIIEPYREYRRAAFHKNWVWFTVQFR